ncbi:transcriptional regulator, PadR-like family [Pyrolobus fumarii 1A]|uniref:Transcriptional regulator, PadR-like family n=1 Tax=Pyrolobus fumarii (strain DSM 11204 / 1A) TaxID=694429 RepID=G0EES0_PYRF1|nr:PadR family transcriptional regulator [Pyrolobus fumarii]AEM38892.1 transcriptional regulator, PadR-like family [Pyrolobus fumarii 1A]
MLETYVIVSLYPPKMLDGSVSSIESSLEQRGVELRTRYLVLLMLAEGPKTGYELLKAIRALLPEIGRGVSPGTLYPLLRSLEEEGCVEAVEEHTGGRRRKVYRLTRKGVETLLSMAARGLTLIETLLRLHLRAADRLRGGTLVSPSLVAEVAERLRVIEELTRQLRARLEEALARIQVDTTRNH